MEFPDHTSRFGDVRMKPLKPRGIGKNRVKTGDQIGLEYRYPYAAYFAPPRDRLESTAFTTSMIKQTIFH